MSVGDKILGIKEKDYMNMTIAEREFAMYHAYPEEIEWMKNNGFKINPIPKTESEMRNWWIWATQYFEDKGMIEIFTIWMPVHFFKFIVTNNKNIFIFSTGSGEVHNFAKDIYPLFHEILNNQEIGLGYINSYLRKKGYVNSYSIGVKKLRLKK